MKVAMDIKFYIKWWRENSIYILGSINSCGVQGQRQWCTKTLRRGARPLPRSGNRRSVATETKIGKVPSFTFGLSPEMKTEGGSKLKPNQKSDIITDCQEFYIYKYKQCKTTLTTQLVSPWVRSGEGGLL